MAYRENAPVLGQPTASFGRTTGQNVGVAGIVVTIIALFGGASYALLPGRPVLAALALCVAALVTGLLLKQILPNWDLRWTIFEQGFQRTRRGTTESARFEHIQGLYRLPGREARIELDDGRTLKIEALARSVALAEHIESCVVGERLRTCQEQLARDEVLVFGPLKLSARDIRVGDRTFPRGAVTVDTHGGFTGPGPVWVLKGDDGAGPATVRLSELPFPALVRALL